MEFLKESFDREVSRLSLRFQKKLSKMIPDSMESVILYLMYMYHIHALAKSDISQGCMSLSEVKLCILLPLSL